MRTSATNRRVHQLMTAISDGKLNARPDFQRRLVWTNDDKVSFIRTVLRGLPFPEIYVCAGTLDAETGEATEFLVDGQQRLTTLHQYFKGASSLKLGDLDPYVQLEVSQKEAFLEYEVVVRDLGKQPLDQIREIFELINSANYALNSIEIKNARYAGAFKRFCESIADREDFKEWKIFKRTDVRRMQDLRYCLVLVATLLSTYFNRDEEIESYLQKYNDEFPHADKMKDEIDHVFDFIRSMSLPGSSRAYRKTDLFSLIVEVHRAFFKRRVSLNAGDAAVRLLAFFDDVETASQGYYDMNHLAVMYYRTTVRAAIDRGNRRRRGEILQSLLDSTYTPQLRFSGVSDESDPGQGELELEEGDY